MCALLSPFFGISHHRNYKWMFFIHFHAFLNFNFIYICVCVYMYIYATLATIVFYLPICLNYKLQLNFLCVGIRSGTNDTLRCMLGIVVQGIVKLIENSNNLAGQIGLCLCVSHMGNIAWRLLFFCKK